MKNTIFSIAAVLTMSTAAAAESTVTGPVLGGSVNVEVTENVAGDYVATTTLGVSIEAEGLAFGSATVESVDGATFEIDEWKIGTHVGAATLSFGKQGDLMVENDFEIVGGDTLADVADDHESLQVSVGAASVMLGFTDITTDVTEIENIQGSYSLAMGQVGVTAVGDYNLNSADWTVGVKANMKMGEVNVGGLVTYGSANKVFAYEASAGYGIATAFVNGDQDDAFQNVGLGVNTDVGGLNVYAEGAYNIDAGDTTIGMGVTFNF